MAERWKPNIIKMLDAYWKQLQIWNDDILVALDSITILTRRVYFVINIIPFYDGIIFIH